ncbi:uncharacterized protein LOC144754265 isoform X3 [Lissotriton helveticus]
MCLKRVHLPSGESLIQYTLQEKTIVCDWRTDEPGGNVNSGRLDRRISEACLWRSFSRSLVSAALWPLSLCSTGRKSTWSSSRLKLPDWSFRTRPE